MVFTRRFCAIVVLITFSLTNIIQTRSYAANSVMGLPQPGTMVNLSPSYVPMLIKGLRVHADNPLLFDFIVDTGNTGVKTDTPALREESQKLIKYFLATLAIPEQDLWVNLSPYEKDRIIPDALGKTELGRDMLAQDYVLKQITASMIYPEKEMGKKFWDKVYAQAQQQFGTTQIPVNTFNKVWILPDQASVFVRNNTAYVVKAHLKVMLEEDYFALSHQVSHPERSEGSQTRSFVAKSAPQDDARNVTNQIIRQIVLPELEKEVNQGQNFAPLRQVFHSLVLASWYKKNLKQAFLNQVYANTSKIGGVEANDKDIKEKIYQQYLAAYKKGVFNYIKEDVDRLSQKPMPKKYFSGGLAWNKVDPAVLSTASPQDLAQTGTFFTIDAAMSASIKATDEIYAAMSNIGADLDVVEAMRSTVQNIDENKIDRLIRIIADANRLLETIASTSEQALNDNNQSLVDELAGYAAKLRFYISGANVNLRRLGVDVDAAMTFEEATKGLSTLDIDYFTALYGKYIKGSGQLEIGGNFIPSAGLTAEARRELMGVVNSKDIVGNSVYQEAASDTELHVMQMNGGLGSSFKRKGTLKRLTGRDTLGPKAADSYFEDVEVDGLDAQGNKKTVRLAISVAELKLLQYIHFAEENKVSSIVVHEMVNEESGKLVDLFYDSVYLMDRVNDTIPAEQKRTYRQMFSTPKLKMADEMIYQGVLPVVDFNNNENLINHPDANAPGGHGVFGTMTFDRLASTEDPRTGIVTAIVNGDGVNNMVPAEIAGYMIHHKIPIVMVTTTKVHLDIKGGELGLETVGAIPDSLKFKLLQGQITKEDLKSIPAASQILEIAQAKAAKQEGLFEEMGLQFGEKGGQLFNTNITAYNEEVLSPFLKKLKVIVGDKKFFEITTPDLIPNPKDKTVDGNKVKVVQMEGAKGSSLLNLNKFIVTTTDPRVIALKQEFGIDRLITFINFDADDRTQVFTPEKYTWDHGVYGNTNLFKVNVQTGRLDKVAHPGESIAHLPALELSDYYTDMEHINIAWGKDAHMDQLDTLVINGAVHFANAVLKGKVMLDNQTSDIVDLNLHKDKFSQENGRLVLDNVRVTIASDGIKVEPVTDAAMNARNAKQAIQTNNRLDNIQNWKIEYPEGKVLTLAEALNKLIKEYDIRGFDGFGEQDKYPQQMDPVLVRWIGRALGSASFTSEFHGNKTVALKPGDTFVIAGDNGPSTDSLMKQNLIEGLRDTGVNVIDLGTIISGELYSNISRLGAQGGLYITRSHVEIGTNGLKPVVGGITLYADMLQAMKPLILNGEYRKAATRGTLNNSKAIKDNAKKLYFDSLRKMFGSLQDLLKDTPMEIAVNLSGGSAAQQDYVDILKELLGNNVKEILRSESDPYNENGGLADPSRSDAVALGHPKADMVAYSKKHPQRLVFSLDLDVDRVGVLLNGELYLGDKMFYPVVEYMLTMDKYKEFNKIFAIDPRMSMQLSQLVERLGGIAKVHPKGHSKVKATMDVMLLDIAKAQGFDSVENFLAKYPDFKLLQPEYSLHLFTTNERGEPGDDALRFALLWVEIFTKIKNRFGQKDWTLADYIKDLSNRKLIDPVLQIPEQRTSMNEDYKKTFMTRMQQHVLDYFNSRPGRLHVEKTWRTYQGSTSPLTLIDVDGVYYLRTPIGEMFWGWSNTSPKDSFGVQATNVEDLQKLTKIQLALWVHTRNEIKSDLPKIEDLETSALRTALGVSSAVEAEQMAVAAYPTIQSVLEALDQAVISPNRNVTLNIKNNATGIAEDGSYADQASVSMDFTRGGIDFNAGNLNTQVSGEAIEFNFDKAMIENFKRGDFTGIKVQILNVTPLPSVLPLFGMAPRREEEKA